MLKPLSEPSAFAFISIAEILHMAGYSRVPAMLPQLINDLFLSSSQARSSLGPGDESFRSRWLLEGDIHGLHATWIGTLLRTALQCQTSSLQTNVATNKATAKHNLTIPRFKRAKKLEVWRAPELLFPQQLQAPLPAVRTQGLRRPRSRS